MTNQPSLIINKSLETKHLMSLGQEQCGLEIGMHTKTIVADQIVKIETTPSKWLDGLLMSCAAPKSNLRPSKMDSNNLNEDLVNNF